MVEELREGSLLLMDRAYFAYEVLARLSQRRIQFVVRAKRGRRSFGLVNIRRVTKNDARAQLTVPERLRRAGLELFVDVGDEAPETSLRK